MHTVSYFSTLSLALKLAIGCLKGGRRTGVHFYCLLLLALLGSKAASSRFTKEVEMITQRHEISAWF